MRVIFIGNCQTEQAKTICDALLDIEVHRVNVKLFNKEGMGGTQVELRPDDIVIYSSIPYLKKKILSSPEFEGLQKIPMPTVSFPGHLPDCVYVRYDSENLDSPIGAYHSFIALSAYQCGYTVEQCVSLFCDKVYRELGWLQMYDADKERLKSELADCGIKPDLVDGWCRETRVMHTVNHPRVFVVEDLLKELFRLNGIEYRDLPSNQFIRDRLSTGPIFPVCIDYSNGVGIPKSQIFFRSGEKEGAHVYALEDFVRRSYEIYRSVDSHELFNERLSREGIEKYRSIYEHFLKAGSDQVKTTHPYKAKPDYCFWKRSISTVSSSDVDPVVSSALNIAKHDKVATAGSCFAQHISNRLSSMDFNYFIPESAPDTMNKEDATANGYGVFSCRYGNIYTARQLLQLFDQAFDAYSPTIAPWKRPDGRFVDPFRPQVVVDGFSSEEEVTDARDAHLLAVKRMFEELDVFVFTLGLTECWEHVEDGAILPLAPGVVAGDMDFDRYRFVNFTKDQVSRDLDLFLDKLFEVNPGARVLLTVSPVPLMATFEDRHVLVSTTVSKSILRVVADEVTSARANVHYFPSYEIITGNFNKGSYYQPDLREIKAEGVDHVMKLFMRHVAQEGAGPNGSSELVGENGRKRPSSEAISEGALLNDIICDEEALDDSH